jgi:4-hydroxy-2-oxoheptanedioate aldolase
MSMPALAGRLRSGETLYCGWVTMPEPLVAETIARSGFDCVVLDMQHGLLDTGSVVRAIGAIALAGKPSVVRIALGDDATASRVLDMGAEGIIAPMVNSVDAARALAGATKYPPMGERSWGPMRAMTLEGIDQPLQYLASANQTSFTFAMIETVRALETLDAILAVDGIDGVFVGPFDLSVSLSAGRNVAPGDAFVDAPIKHIAARANAVGKVAGIYSPTPERARTFRDFGYRFIAVAGDQGYLTYGAAEMLRSARQVASVAA